jgi:NitT/TauT family transport system substrate-binding protein
MVRRRSRLDKEASEKGLRKGRDHMGSRRLTILAGALAALFCATAFAPARAADLIRVGDGPFITGGPFFIARDKGYFKKMGLKIETKRYIDGSLAVPSLISGELDISNMPAAAALFNSIAKGAPIVIILDWGHNKPGRGYTVTSVTKAMYDQGVHSLADFAKLKGKRFGVGAIGSINQYNLAQALLRVGLDPAKDVHWIVNVPQPDLMKMLGQNQVDVTDLAYQFGYFAQTNKWGPIIATGDQIAPNGQIAAYVVRKGFLKEHRDAMIRFAMAYLQGIKEFDAAAANPDKYP